MLDAQLVKLETKTNRHRTPPWILEVALVFPRPGIDERVRFREIKTETKKWRTDIKTPDNFIFRERVDKDFPLVVKIRRDRKKWLLKVFDTVKSAIGQGFSSSSPFQWYTIRDMLDAGERVSGVREMIRAKNPPDMEGFIVIEEKEYDGEIEIPLYNLDDWKNPYPKMGDIRDRDYIEIIREKGTETGRLTLKIRREL